MTWSVLSSFRMRTKLNLPLQGTQLLRHPARGTVCMLGGLRQAHVDQRATAAVRTWYCRRSLPVSIQPVHGGSKFFGPCPKVRGKEDLLAPPWIAVEDCALWNGSIEHLLQTKRLRAELHGIAVAGLALAPLVLDGIGVRTELDDVGAPGQVELLRP